MLAKLLVRYLKPSGWLLLGVLLFQSASALASLRTKRAVARRPRRPARHSNTPL